MDEIEGLNTNTTLCYTRISTSFWEWEIDSWDMMSKTVLSRQLFLLTFVLEMLQSLFFFDLFRQTLHWLFAKNLNQSHYFPNFFFLNHQIKWWKSVFHFTWTWTCPQKTQNQIQSSVNQITYDVGNNVAALFSLIITVKRLLACPRQECKIAALHDQYMLQWEHWVSKHILIMKYCVLCQSVVK